MRVLGMLGSTLLIAAVVWMSVGADAVALFRAAWWAPLVMLAWPAFLAFGIWRGWGD